MHILIVTDQHPDSLGGAQVAIRAQRAALERAGHRVTIAAPALRRASYVARDEDRTAHINLPSMAITKDHEYGLSWPGRRTDRALAGALQALPPVDVVHVQGDFWGAMIGIRAARGLSAARRMHGPARRMRGPARRATVPLVFTLHNNVDRGTRAVTPLAPVLFAALRAWRWLTLGRPRGAVSSTARGAWRYLAELTSEAAAVIAPSRHFAAELEAQGVFSSVDVVRGGVDDELIADALAEVSRAGDAGLPDSSRARERVAGGAGSPDSNLTDPKPAHSLAHSRSPANSRYPSHSRLRSRPLLTWLGRMSHEKRVLEFVDALGLAQIDADVRLYGAGLLLEQVRERITAAGLESRVRIAGPVSHSEALAAMRDSDALVQTSVGFETQGLTPFEAALLGTPTIFCDSAIADDASIEPSWVVPDSSVEALAETLRKAVTELTEAATRGVQLRVPAEQASGFLQSEQTHKLVELYERLLTDTRKQGST